jgi:hypothetical protein
MFSPAGHARVILKLALAISSRLLKKTHMPMTLSMSKGALNRLTEIVLVSRARTNTNHEHVSR